MVTIEAFEIVHANDIKMLAYIKRHEDSIFVRDMIKGKIGSYAMSELLPEQWALWAVKFMRQGVEPVVFTGGDGK